MNTIVAFSAEQTCRLTGLSPRQLSYWSNTDFFPSQLGTHKHGGPFSRVYSFRDVVGLRVLAILRNEYNVPLQQLRRLGQYLKERYADPWSALTFFVVGDKVFYQDQETEARMSGQRLGQTVIPFQMLQVAQDTSREADRLRHRDSSQLGKITRNRNLMSNAWVLEGTRIPTRSVWNLHAAGYSENDILREYPTLTPVDVSAAIEFEQKQRKRKAG